ncbi:solute carrier family 23 member 1-like [Patiria miniata]|uniref:Solute carrier family 23 member 1-like n=1 Tax=Patiria miniata TaxID=46514 RepID=A0A914ACF7_PATMI|nr:solute carrier family 23 member 1-like [Patiria miniata]
MDNAGICGKARGLWCAQITFACLLVNTSVRNKSIRHGYDAMEVEMADINLQTNAEDLDDKNISEDDGKRFLEKTAMAVDTDHVKAETGTRRARPLHDLVYGLEDMPPWYTTILLGLQHFMTNFGSNVSTAFILAPYLCISHDPATMAKIIGTLFFITGVVTVLQTTIGVRLPIIQGTTFAFLVPTFSILRIRGECPPAPTENSTMAEIDAAEEEWLSRIREIQGAIMVASCVQVIIGATGIVGILLNCIGPLTITTTISLIGLSLHKAAADKAGTHWGIAVMTIVLIILFSQYISEIGVPTLSYNSRRKCHVTRFKLFKLFPLILGVAVSWLFCAVFTATDVFPDDPSVYGYAARTDLNSMVLERAPWFRFPYPGQWGTPTVTLSGVLGITAGVFASIVESIGDYYACARMSGAPAPPQHAINRGIMIEGIGCILAGAWGSGNGTTSHSENIGAIGLTKVGSRVVVQAAGCIMIVTGLIGKISAVFATIPEPVVGGVLCITFGMVTAVGLSNLQFVDLNSSRNLFVLGFSTLMGLIVPYYFEENPGLIKTGSVEFDQIVTVMFTTGMFVGGFLAIILDNTIPGTDEERGLLSWRDNVTGDTQDSSYEDESAENEAETDEDVEKNYLGLTVMNGGSDGVVPITNRPTETALPPCYDLPLVTRFIRRWAWCRYLPVSPTFQGFKFGWITKSCKKKKR